MERFGSTGDSQTARNPDVRAGEVAAIADALVNLMTWARAGRKAPMYATREASIAEKAARPAGAGFP